VRKKLANQLLRKTIFNWVLRNTRARVKARENLRFERTRVFGRVRCVFSEIGRRLVSEGVLENERDVFYLTVEEVLAFIEGTAVNVELKALAKMRQKEFEEFREGPAPSDRFETTGAVYVGNRFQTQNAVAIEPAEERQGLGCCPGIVRGVARVILEPRNAEIKFGEILVAPRTDPGWILLFPAAAGLLVEHGSLLSHSAIVSREMGIPAVVSIPGLTEWLHTGDLVEMDGSKGTVRKVTA
jgi:pyruvate,water dikinase